MTKALLAVMVLLAGCTTGSPAGGPSPSPVATPAPTFLAATGCPVTDTDFCARAAVAANALLTGDPDALASVVTVETFTCDQMPAGVVPACRPGQVLAGLGVFAVATKISVVPTADYLGWLSDLLDRVDPEFADERGSGRFAVLGVGTCGPDDPDRRSYHLAFTAALRGTGGQPTERWLGSLEFVRRDGAWGYALVYLDTVAAWRTEHSDPFRSLACGNVRPWTVG